MRMKSMIKHPVGDNPNYYQKPFKGLTPYEDMDLEAELRKRFSSDEAFENWLNTTAQKLKSKKK
jgi:hypothetical protein